MAYSIMLDAGHGGAKDPGAVYEGRQEKDDNLKLVLAIGEILSDRGLDVEYTRTTDVYETPYEKAMKANNAGVDLFVIQLCQYSVLVGFQQRSIGGYGSIP